jgi:hypothetical protein
MLLPDTTPSTIADPGTQPDLARTLNTIMAQLTSLGNRLDLQGKTLAWHAQLLDGAEVSTAPLANLPPQNIGAVSGIVHGSSTFHQPPPPPRDYRDNLRQSFHRPKINFPHYDGESNPLPWLNRCESYFRGTRTLAVEQVWMASLQMGGVAAKWYYALECEYGHVSWARFAEFVNLRFRPPLHSNPLGELKELRCTGLVEEYQRQFLVMLCRCDGLSAFHAMNMFTAGLGEPMTSDVEMQRPEDLQVAMSLARAFERRASVAPPKTVVCYQPRSRALGVAGSTAVSASTATTARAASPNQAASITASSPAPTVRSCFHR